jgi:ryanodine receptor 2
LEELLEQLARNVHDRWALQRLDEGWRLGEQRDDLRKLHPCLVAYEKLPESEKDYDRSTAVETIKAIIALGYQINKVDGIGTRQEEQT